MTVEELKEALVSLEMELKYCDKYKDPTRRHYLLCFQKEYQEKYRKARLAASPLRLVK